MADASPSGFGGAEQRIPANKSELVSLVAALLEENPEDLDEHENLIEYGIDSIGVMRIVSLWNREGLDITVGELFAHPTIAEWWDLLSECTAIRPADDTAVDVDLGAPFELSPVQHAYWVGRTDGQVLGGVGCHIYLEVDGAGVDPDGLERAVSALTERHPMLRARFLEDGTQQIMPKAAWTGLTRHDLRDLDEAAAERELTRIRARLSHRRLSVERGEVFDVRLSLLPGGRTRLHIELDLLVADVLSFNVFLDDLAACYTGGVAALRPLTYSFPQYRADLGRSRSAAYVRDREYWLSRLADLPSAPRLPLAQDPALIERPVFRRLEHRLEPESFERLVQLSRRNQVTPAMVLATAFAEILGRWSGQSRLLLNLPLFDRVALHDDVAGMIADFTNLVLLDVDLSGDSFLDRVRAVQQRFQTDISHSAYSAVEVLRDISRHTDLEAQTAPVVFASNAGGGELLSGRFRQSFGELGYSITQTPQVWLDHQLMDMENGVYLNWDFVEGLFPEGVVEGMFGAYCGVLEWLVEGDWSGAAPVVLPAGQTAVRERVSETGAAESGRLLHEGFFERAGVEPGRVALVWGEGGELSYGGLAEWALRIGGGLVARGVEPGDAVAVTVPKGPEQVAAILGVLAAGGVYVPVGVDQPAARRALMIEAADVRHAVVHEAAGEWPAGVRVWEYEELAGSDRLSEPVFREVSDSAYVIFTSGSTGRPKGVEVSHRAAVNTVEDVNERFGVGADDRVLAVSAADFDLSVYDMFGLLAVGGALVLIEEGDRREAQRWVELCRRHEVTVWNSVPALFDMYLSVAEARALDDRLRLVLVSGDWVGLDLPGRFRERCPEGRFVAMGGATEAAIWSNAIEVERVPEEWRSIPYGFALRNQRYRVVDQAGRDCPDWVPGELWIGGVGVAEGYRGDPAKTAEKFLVRDGERWYRTGDLGRFWSDGTLEFLGRADHQVKVRGFRIELGEIESVLEAHPHIGRAVVAVVGTGTQQKIAAAVVTHPGDQAVDVEAVRDWTGERLPGHMVPERLVGFADLPLTANGKVDRARVVAELAGLAEQQAAEAAAEPPRGPMEEAVARLWTELLSLEQVHRTDNFFHCGGDSLIGTRMIAGLMSEGIAGAELRLLFAHPVLADFAALLRPEESGAAVVRFDADEAARYEPFPATDVQRAYWFGRRPEFTLGGVGCHFYTEFDGTDVDLDRLERAWNTLIERHEILRAVFDDQGMQRIQPSVPRFTITVQDAATDGQHELEQLRDTMSHRVFDPTVWPLFDVRAVRHGQRTRIGVGLDNLILDALSVLILMTELEQLYRDPEATLRPVGVSFRDYQRNAQPAQSEVDAAREYWLSRIDDLPPAPQLPLATDPMHIERPRFARNDKWLDAEQWARVTERARQYGLTPSALLLTCYAEVLGAWSTRPDMTFVLTTFQRREVHPDINNILGDFTSLLLVSYRPEPGSGLLDRARALQEQMWQDLDHQAVPATWVLREMARRAGTAEVSMPLVFTSALGIVEGLPDLGPDKHAEVCWGISQTPQVWLDHQVREHPDGVYLNWDFVEGLFPEGVVEGMFGAYCGVLEWLVEGDWSGAAPVVLPAGQTAVRERVSETGAAESGRLLHEGFFERAGVEPGRVALVWGEGGELSYGGLAEWALRIGGGLVARGVEPGDAVAVTVPKGPEQVAAILGVLAAGGVYVPVGVDQPAARRALMIEAADVRHAVVHEAAGEWPAGVRVWEYEELAGSDRLSEPVFREVSDSAYVIFTSGSTGRPKGVEVSHRAAVNTVEDVNERFGVGADDRVLAVSAADFDLSVYDMFGLLAVGGALVLIEEGDRREAQRWVELCRRHEVTVWNSVPALFDMYLSVAEARALDDRLRLVLVSGDWVGLDLPGRFRERCPEGRFVAMGGATEAAIWSNAIEVERVPEEWRSIPYGFALRNQRYRVVDQAGRDCPDWVPGELWIGGVGVAEGYRGDPAKTAEKFLVRDGERWYRTGDLGRFWSDGTLEFLGRADHQVKVRGFRIELGEIESVLEAHPHIGRAVVTTVGTGSRQKLVAAVTTDPDGATATPEVLTGPTPTVEITAESAADSAVVEAALIESWMAGVISAGITDTPASLGDVARRLGTADDMRSALRLWLDWLVTREVLAGGHDAYATGKRWETALDPRTWQDNLDLATGVVRTIADRLADMTGTITGILRGERDPLLLVEDAVMSPEATVTHRPDTESALRGAAAAITALAAELGRPVRVAEPGARSGAAARRLLETVAPGDIELTLFDAAPRLLESAEARLSDLPHSTAFHVVRDGVLPPEARHAFDVVLANNSLHRYADPVAGAAEVRHLLVPGGILIGLEHAELAPIGLLTAGLIEHGFSAVRGERARAGGRAGAGGPLLDKSEWAEVLHDGGLRDVTITERDDTSLMLLVARAAVDLPVVREPEVLALARDRLPAHMVPERLLMLPALPLSANGKIDRARIGTLFAEQPDPGDGGEAPRTPMEETVARMWSELLHVPEVARAHNFFALGGDSLTATGFAEAIRARFGVELVLRQMFQEPTVAAVAASIDASLETVGAADGSMEDGVL